MLRDSVETGRSCLSQKIERALRLQRGQTSRSLQGGNEGLDGRLLCGQTRPVRM